MSLADYMHERLGGQPSRRARGKCGPDTEWRVKMLAAMGRSGNNLNQLLRRVNSYDFRGHPELVAMQRRDESRPCRAPGIVRGDHVGIGRLAHADHHQRRQL